MIILEGLALKMVKAEVVDNYSEMAFGSHGSNQLWLHVKDQASNNPSTNEGRAHQSHSYQRGWEVNFL